MTLAKIDNIECLLFELGKKGYKVIRFDKSVIGDILELEKESGTRTCRDVFGNAIGTKQHFIKWELCIDDDNFELVRV